MVYREIQTDGITINYKGCNFLILLVTPLFMLKYMMLIIVMKKEE